MHISTFCVTEKFDGGVLYPHHCLRLNGTTLPIGLLRRYRVVDSSGEAHTVQEWGDFVRVKFLEGWSEWARSSGRLQMDGQHVNPTDAPNVFEVALTGEKLTEVPPGQ